MNPISWIVGATDAVADGVGSHALAHVHAGLVIYVLVQMLIRDRRASIHALIAVFGLEAANELVEAVFYGSARWADTIGDIALTGFWPVMLFIASLWRRARWNGFAFESWHPPQSPVPSQVTDRPYGSRKWPLTSLIVPARLPLRGSDVLLSK